MVDKQQLAAMGEHMQEEIAWRNKDSPNGIRKFMTERQYQNQSDAIKQYYEPYSCANCMDSEFKVPDGWKLVPVNPTSEMILTGIAAQDEKLKRYALGGSLAPIDHGMLDAYNSMLSAAPEYKP